MVNYSPIEYEALRRRQTNRNVRHQNMLSALDAQDRNESESALHNAILDYCKARRWAVIHGRMDKRSGVTPGAPDFVIFATRELLIVECKTKTGKQTTEQRAFQMMVEGEGYKYHLVRSF